MEVFDRKAHWEHIYNTKEFTDVSWYQAVPQISLDFLNEFKLPKDAEIIDVGGGDSFFVDHLLELGYQHISVLDISAQALVRAKKRLGDKAKLVNWIVSDIATFKPQKHYDFWHDRAVFHFLTSDDEIEKYTQVLADGIKAGGVLILGTFSENGPTKCSGIPIKQYSEESMSKRLSGNFNKIRCFTVDHKTPFDTVQNFVFCSFRRLQAA